MPFWTKDYRFLCLLATFFFLAIPHPAAAQLTPPDTLKVPAIVHGVESVPISVTGTAFTYDPDDLTHTVTLSQTNNAPFLSGLGSSGPSKNPSINLSGTPTFQQSGTYTINWTLHDTLVSAYDTTATTTVVIHDLFGPSAIQAYYTDAPPNVPIANGTGVLTFVVWDGAAATADPLGWNGFRVRRTIHGVSAAPMELAGQYVNQVLTTHGFIHPPVSPICFAQSAPCIPDSFVFTGTGLFFKGFQRNSLGNGRYAIDYPPGAPVDNCSTCWVFADLATLAGFQVDYAVTTIGPFLDNDYVETPLAQAPVVSITPGTSPTENLERVAVVPNPYKHSAQWDPAVGEGRIHFIHLPVGAHVRIFTANAELVWEKTLNSQGSPGGETGELEWNLQNGKGQKVVSGIYLYQVETPAGRARKGHFVIIK